MLLSYSTVGAGKSSSTSDLQSCSFHGDLSRAVNLVQARMFLSFFPAESCALLSDNASVIGG